MNEKVHHCLERKKIGGSLTSRIKEPFLPRGFWKDNTHSNSLGNAHYGGEGSYSGEQGQSELPSGCAPTQRGQGWSYT